MEGSGPTLPMRNGASGHFDGEPIWWWEWSRCDHSARAERAVRVTTGPWRTKPARRSARRDGSQREPFHQVEPFHHSVWMRQVRKTAASQEV